MNMVAGVGRQLLIPVVVTVRRLSISGTSSARLAGVKPESAIGDRVAIESWGAAASVVSASVPVITLDSVPPPWAKSHLGPS
jgi:hypothetical protein